MKKDMRVVWMIFDGKRPILEPAYQWEFEKEDQTPPQKLYLTFQNKKEAQKYLDKWHDISPSFRIVRAEIKFPQP